MADDKLLIRSEELMESQKIILESLESYVLEAFPGMEYEVIQDPAASIIHQTDNYVYEHPNFIGYNPFYGRVYEPGRKQPKKKLIGLVAKVEVIPAGTEVTNHILVPPGFIGRHLKRKPKKREESHIEYDGKHWYLQLDVRAPRRKGLKKGVVRAALTPKTENIDYTTHGKRLAKTITNNGMQVEIKSKKLFSQGIFVEFEGEIPVIRFLSMT